MKLARPEYSVPHAILPSFLCMQISRPLDHCFCSCCCFLLSSNIDWLCTNSSTFITFHMRHSWWEMYIGNGHVCVFLSFTTFPHYCTDPDATWGNGKGYPLVVQYWADLQSVHGFCCYNTHACKLIVLYTANAYSAEREMSATACAHSMAG